MRAKTVNDDEPSMDGWIQRQADGISIRALWRYGMKLLDGRVDSFTRGLALLARSETVRQNLGEYSNVV